MSSRNRAYIWILALSVSCLLLACKKQDPAAVAEIKPLGPGPCTPVLYEITNPDLLQCKFKAGSFWIYKDSLSSAIDTLVMEEAWELVGGDLYYITTCVRSRIYNMRMTMRQETDATIKTFTYAVYPTALVAWNPYYWYAGEKILPALMKVSNPKEAYIKFHDSLWLGGQKYMKVSESQEFQFVQALNPNLLATFKRIVYFTSDQGPVQFDLRDRITGALIRREQLISKHIVR